MMNITLRDKGYSSGYPFDKLPVVDTTYSNVYLGFHFSGSRMVPNSPYTFMAFGFLFNKNGGCIHYAMMETTPNINPVTVKFIVFSTNGTTVPYPSFDSLEAFNQWATENGFLGTVQTNAVSIPHPGEQSSFKLPFYYRGSTVAQQICVDIINEYLGSPTGSLVLNFNITSSPTGSLSLSSINYFDIEVLNRMKVQVENDHNSVIELNERVDSLSSVMNSRFVSR